MRRANLVGLLVIGSLTAVPVAAQTCEWRWVHPNPPRVDLLDVAGTSSGLVAVGRSGVVSRTVDGSTWESGDAGSEGDLTAVAVGAGRWVAVGDGRVIASVDGLEWATVFTDESMRFSGVAFTLNRFLAASVAEAGGGVLTSDRGDEWQVMDVPWSGRTEAIAGSSQRAVALSGDELFQSLDGLGWELLDRAPARFEAYLGDSPLVRRSLVVVDEVTLLADLNQIVRWQADGPPEIVFEFVSSCAPWSGITSIAAEPGVMIATAREACPPLLEPTASVYTSLDQGRTWSLALGDSGQAWTASARGAGVSCVVGASGDFMVGSQAGDWTCLPGSCSSDACQDVLFDLVETAEERSMAVGGVGPCDMDVKRQTGSTVAVSANTVDWTVAELAAPETMTGVAYGDGRVVATASDWIGVTENEGADWTGFSDGASALYSGVAWNGEEFLVVGDQGTAWISGDGYTWNPAVTGVTERLRGVAVVSDEFWVFGDNGFVSSSRAGTRWTRRPVPTASSIRGVAESEDGVLIAVGAEGTVVVRAGDGPWSVPFTGLHGDVILRDVVFRGGRAVAVGGTSDGRALVIASDDHTRWTRWELPWPELAGVLSVSQGLVASGSGRALLQAPCLGQLIAFARTESRVQLNTSEPLLVEIEQAPQFDVVLNVTSSVPSAVSVPDQVTLLAGSRSAEFDAYGSEAGRAAVVTVGLPPNLGGGQTSALVRVVSPNAVRRGGSRRVP